MGTRTNACFPTNPAMRACVRSQIKDPQERAKFDRSSKCYKSFVQYARRKLHLFDACAYSYKVYARSPLAMKPPAALMPRQRAKFIAMAKVISQLMKTSGYTKGSKKWIELASFALFWAAIGKPKTMHPKKKGAKRWLKAYQRLYRAHVKKHPILAKWYGLLTNKGFSFNVASWKGSSKIRDTLSMALAMETGACTEVTNLYIRLWREFMNHEKITTQQAQVTMMTYHNWCGCPYAENHNFSRVTIPGQNFSLDLDLLLTINVNKKTAYSKSAKPSSEFGRWITYLFNGRGIKFFMKYWKRHGAILGKHPEFRWYQYNYYRLRGNQLLEKGKFKASRVLFKRSLAMLPKISRLKTGIIEAIAVSYFFEGKYGLAMREINRAIRMNPKHAGLKLSKAIQLLGQRKYKTADAILSKIKVKRIAIATRLLGVAKSFVRKSWNDIPNSKRHLRHAINLLDYAVRFIPRKARYANSIRRLILQRKYVQAEPLIKHYMKNKSLNKTERKFLKLLSDMAWMTYMEIRTISSNERGFKFTVSFSPTRIRSCLNHRISLRAVGNHDISGAVLAGYEFSGTIPFPFPDLSADLFMRGEVGISNYIAARMSAWIGARLNWLPTDGNRFYLGFSGGAISWLGRDIKKIEPFGRASFGYRRILGATPYNGGAVGHSLFAEAAVLFDKRFRWATGTVGYQLSF